MKLFEALDRYNKVRHNNWKNGRYLKRNKWGNVVNERGEDWLVNFNIVDDNDWEEDKGDILDEKEKEYLRAVIKPFRHRVKYIKKIEAYYGRNDKGENIFVRFCDKYGSEDCFSLPWFPKGSMYRGMILNKEYTLEELGL